MRCREEWDHAVVEGNENAVSDFVGTFYHQSKQSLGFVLAISRDDYVVRGCHPGEIDLACGDSRGLGARGARGWGVIARRSASISIRSDKRHHALCRKIVGEGTPCRDGSLRSKVI